MDFFLKWSVATTSTLYVPSETPASKERPFTVTLPLGKVKFEVMFVYSTPFLNTFASTVGGTGV